MKIGYLYAMIGGDSRYTDSLAVIDEGQCVRVTVSSTGAIGGMDGPGGAYAPEVDFNETCPRDVESVLALVRRVCRDRKFNFKDYGKPTKNFVWHTGDRGLSKSKVDKALKNA